MNALMHIINTYKARQGMKYDNEVAAKLHVKPQAFSGYIKGKSQLPQILIARLADGADMPPLDVMAAVNLTYEKTPEEEKTYWVELLKKAGKQAWHVT